MKSKKKNDVIYILVIIFILLTAAMINKGMLRAPYMISNWDNGLDGWGEIDPENFVSLSTSELPNTLTIEYDWHDEINREDWFIVAKFFKNDQDWSKYNGLIFGVLSNESKTKFRVMIKDNDEWWVTGNYEKELYSLNGGGGKRVVCEFEKLKIDSLSSIGDKHLNLHSIQGIGFNFWDDTTRSGEVHISMLQLTNFPWWKNNLLLIVLIVIADISLIFLIIFFSKIMLFLKKLRPYAHLN